MSLWIPERAPEQELLDTEIASGEAEASLRDIEWVHRYMGGRRLVRRRLTPFLLSLPGGALTLADLGCGSGHVGRDVEATLACRGRTARVFGVDRKLAHVRLGPRGSAVAGDVFTLPLGSRSVDVVYSTLFFHHFSPAELRAVLHESGRVARLGLMALDLARHRAALALISLVGPLAFESRVSVTDGRASVRQAYTAAEMREIAEPVLPGVRVEAAGPFVWQLTWLRP